MSVHGDGKHWLTAHSVLNPTGTSCQMIEITTFGLMVMAMIAGALIRDFWRARRDRLRAYHMDTMVSHYASHPVEELVNQIGEPYEMAQGLSERALYIWKAPPNEK